MRIALVWTHRDRLVDVSIPCGRYVQGFRELGHEAFAVCLAQAADEFAEPVVTCPSASAFQNKAFWDALELDAAVVVTWLGKPEVLKALRSSCPYLVSLADSDGQLGVRAHPAATWSRMLAQQPTLINKLRAAKFWVQQYAWAYRRVEAPTLASAELADAIAMGGTAAAAHLRAYFASRGRPELGRKILLSPYPVADCFLDGPVPEEREDRVLAIGRWADPQKDAPLLAAALAEVVRRRHTTEVVLIGSGGGPYFRSLCQAQPRVRYLGQQDSLSIAKHLGASRSLVLSSRWEGSPVVANEALALGCTVVGPAAVPGLVSLCATGEFGSLAPRRTSRQLAAALCADLVLWDARKRSPTAIAGHWRPQLQPKRVCQGLLENLPVAGVALSTAACC